MSLPITQVKLVVETAAEALSTVVKLLSGGSIFGAIGLLSSLSALKGVNKHALLDQLKDADPAERAELLAAFKSKLVLEDKALEAKIESGADCLDEAIGLGIDAYEVIERGVALVGKVKGVIGVNS
jgi:hypothetical protein